MQNNVEKSQFEAGGAKRIGYRNPPPATRFKKGESGNPKGRPKGSLSVAKVLERTLREKVVITEKGQRKTITKLEAAVKQLVNKAASGDPRALQSLLKLSREAESPERQSQPTNQAPGEIDQKVMEGILRRIQAAKNDEGGQK
jgi:hypothetical protein